MKRRLFVASTAALIGLDACTGGVKAQLTDSLRDTLNSAELLNHAVIGTRGMARLYSDADVDAHFRVNGLDTPTDTRYAAAMADGSRGYRLPVIGLVDAPHTYTLAELRAMPLQTQITRHDCVEGWSAIGKWRGVPLATVLAMVKPQAAARYVVFHCFDRDDSGTEYYESLNLHQAAHPQTLLALDLNDAPLDPDHGAPVRLRIPTQLGYKSAKWVRQIELASAFPRTLLAQGGYWEDQGYEWYAGI
jgi:DMSO/TMAO reductase YedYZ molybdopterin-dependent catalytic subunit